MPQLPILVTLTSIFLALQAFATCTPHPPDPPQPKCNAAFFTPLLPAGTTLEKIAIVEKGGSYGEGEANLPFPVDPTDLPALCAVTIAVQSSETSRYRFGLFLPLAKEWSGRFLVVGNGGFGGGINWIEMGSGARYGMATVSTDTGHSSDPTDSAWALNQPERRIDWGWRSIHGATVLGKQLVNAYYARPLTFSYYSGCSTGGRQGLKELQLSPDSFDGALIGAAAWWTSHTNNYLTQVGLFNLPKTDPKHLSLDDVAVLAEEVTRQCDGADGVVDGIISSPERCTPDLSTLLCSSSTTGNKCLTQAQISTAHNIYNDYLSATKTTADGTPQLLHPGLTLSSEPQWDAILNDTEPSPFGVGYGRNFLFDDPTWDWRTFNESVIRYADAHDPGGATADDYAALGKVRARGGKVLMYHGLADGLVPTKGSELYINRTIEALGRGKGLSGGNPQKSLDDFFRLFLVPGMQHCGDTTVGAPWAFGGASQAVVLSSNTSEGGDGNSSSGGGWWSVPGFEDAEHDALMALVRWVEEGRAVESIVATTWESALDPTSGVKRQRPLCPWPRRAVWDGKGGVDEAESWNCEG